jgi:enolase
MLALAVEAIGAAGYGSGKDVFLGVDVAASHFYEDNIYSKDGNKLDSAGMIQTLAKWLDEYPILSLEDGLAEDDWENWPDLRRAINGRALTLGDDLLCTNPARIRRAAEASACDALLLKVNQIGTLTEALDACKLARAAGWSITLSVRSGETEDNWAADLAVGWGADQFKNGSIRQSERLAKYNRMLEIEESTHWPLADWPGRG